MRRWKGTGKARVADKAGMTKRRVGNTRENRLLSQMKADHDWRTRKPFEEVWESEIKKDWGTR